MFRLIFLFIIYVSFPLLGVSQQWLGISGSNYTGTNTLYTNPANVADSRYKVYVNLIGNDLFLTNNFINWDAPYSILQLFSNTVPSKYRNSSTQNIIYSDDYLATNQSNGKKHFHTIDDLRGPSIMISLNDQQAFALSTRIRTGINFTGMESQFAEFIRTGIKNVDLQNKLVSLNGTSFNTNSFVEIGLTFGQVLFDEEEDFVKIGGTIKRLVGLYSAHLMVNNANYGIINDPANPDERLLQLNNIIANYGYTLNGAYENARFSPSWLLGNDSAGNGWGFDIGFVYEYRPNLKKFSYREKGVLKLDPSKNKYKYRLGVSLIDIGGLKYTNPNYVKNWQVNTTNQVFNSADYKQKITDLDDAFERFSNSLNLNNAQAKTLFNSSLPTALSVNFDYHYKNNIYINSVWTQALRSDYSVGIKSPSLLAVTPRWETKWAEVAMPFALLDNYSTFSFGLAARLGPVFLGTDNLGSILNISKPRGLNLYFGASIPIFRRPPTVPNACFYENSSRKSFKEILMFWKK
ncbi:DUF5723 family protein [Arcicella rosea]|uniref:DUF5723 domain-containing protein n=1 Tax=Arcicella rosea TaxID=502909 RepID=A0A841ESQ3_9BACT|nr:DUF5723 family protein [Arcicella rosea]MBB6002471.1 hypothetical protein [Arcicella rosea]